VTDPAQTNDEVAASMGYEPCPVADDDDGGCEACDARDHLYYRPGGYFEPRDGDTRCIECIRVEVAHARDIEIACALHEFFEGMSQ
jgi:hypothetical protein